MSNLLLKDYHEVSVVVEGSAITYPLPEGAVDGWYAGVSSSAAEVAGVLAVLSSFHESEGL